MKLLTAVFARQRAVLLLMLLASLLAHAAAFWTVTVVDRPGVSGWTARPRVHLMQPSLDVARNRQPLYRLAELMDPSLLGPPSRVGFSGKMWAKTVTVGLQPQVWNIDPAYLQAHPAPAIPTLLPQPAATDVLQVAVSLMATPPTESTNHVSLARGDANRSTFQVRGGLETRAVVKSARVPLVTQPGGLRPTSVRVAVGDDGSVKYATVERPSGSDWADTQAVELARQIQFEPVGHGQEDLQWGLLRFYWATSPTESRPEKPAPEGAPR